MTMDPRANESSRRAGDGPSLYRLGSNQSSTSIFENVEMAQDELFSGPVAESLPTSVSAFAHQRSRANSVTSFRYYNEDDEDATVPFEDYDRRGSMDSEEISVDGIYDGRNVEALEGRVSQDSALQRRLSMQSASSSVHHRLLRSNSVGTVGSGLGFGRSSQKIYLLTEDMTIAVAGFRNSKWGLWLYTLICLATGGIGYLLFRWLPRWYVKVLGKPCALGECHWVVIENQWGELSLLDVQSRPYGRLMSTAFGLPRKATSLGLNDDLDPMMAELRVIDYRYMRLLYHPAKDKFVLFSGWKDPNWVDVQSARAGIDSEEKSVRERVFGANMIDIEQKSIPQLLVDEVLHPFYVFQVASLILWTLDSYWLYAMCIFLISVAGIVTTLIDTRATMKRLREISRFECDVRILRNGFWRYVSSSDLVPGDVYEISDPNLAQFPADSLLLSGDCIVNESMLTGESVPVTKTPATEEALHAMDLTASTTSAETARHFLFCGTRIVRARKPHDVREGEAVALALVVRTGFSTTKGSLVRSMLFPKPSGFKFYRDSFRFVCVMALIALIGFFATFINFMRLGIRWNVIVVRALDLVTIAVPPALPITLTIGTGFALGRLKKKQIFCISPQRVNVAGKLDVMCFDKTGTLTEEGLDVLGVRVVLKSLGRFSDALTDAQSLVSINVAAESRDTMTAVLYTMATCHSLRSIDGELVGDPLDLKMFEFTEWSFHEGSQNTGEDEDEDQRGLTPSIARPPPVSLQHAGNIQSTRTAVELGVLRSFEFVSHLRRASVVVRHFGQQSGDVYVKGAPECMRDICRPKSFPSDYDGLLAHYTHKGYRVIGCATRHIKKLSWVKAHKLKREDVECDLEFVGFIIFENKLKPTTAAVMNELLQSNIGAVMVTGDNILTAVSVARECNIIDKTAHCFVPRFVQGNTKDPNSRLQWESIDNAHLQLDSSTLTPLPLPAEYDASLPFALSDIRNYSLAVSGEVFRWVVDFGSPKVLHSMLVCGKVFARMSPDEKHELVEKLQSIDYCAGFCGDGANDCGALKVADVGISLSEAEASVAAPFTSRVFDIRCVPEVIREGRAALVTSFSCFKYMSLYSAIQSTTVSFLYASASNLGEYQFLFIDMLLMLPLAVFMSLSEPYPHLVQKSPTAKLVSRKVLVPLLGHMGICLAIQAITYHWVRQQVWYIPPVIKPGAENIRNSENTTLFLISCFQYVFAGVVLNAGRPFRKSLRHNVPFIVTVLAALLLTIYMVMGPVYRIKKIMQLTKTRWDFGLLLIGLGFCYFAAAWTSENYLFPAAARVIGFVKVQVMRRPKKRKEYKLIKESMRC